MSPRVISLMFFPPVSAECRRGFPHPATELFSAILCYLLPVFARLKPKSRAGLCFFVHKNQLVDNFKASIEY
jgi:hypothetical protein